MLPCHMGLCVEACEGRRFDAWLESLEDRALGAPGRVEWGKEKLGPGPECKGAGWE